jgi:sorting nexin-8
LIPYNATNVKDVLKCPSEDHLQEFRNIVASYNVFCTIRRTMGADIDSACGQLVQSVKASEEKQEPTSVVDIEDVVATKMEKRAVAVNMLTSKRQSAETVCNGSHLHDNHTSHVDLESWIRPLTVATVLSAVCLVVSATRYFQPTKQR